MANQFDVLLSYHVFDYEDAPRWALLTNDDGVQPHGAASYKDDHASLDSHLAQSKDAYVHPSWYLISSMHDFDIVFDIVLNPDGKLLENDMEWYLETKKDSDIDSDVESSPELQTPLSKVTISPPLSSPNQYLELPLQRRFHPLLIARL